MFRHGNWPQIWSRFDVNGDHRLALGSLPLLLRALSVEGNPLATGLQNKVYFHQVVLTIAAVASGGDSQITLYAMGLSAMASRQRYFRSIVEGAMAVGPEAAGSFQKNRPRSPSRSPPVSPVSSPSRRKASVSTDFRIRFLTVLKVLAELRVSPDAMEDHERQLRVEAQRQLRAVAGAVVIQQWWRAFGSSQGPTPSPSDDETFAVPMSSPS